ncbi:MAG TPA: hypothetical protein VJM81_07180 [Rhizorhapis sp.]|nr:hypothetical protein [Rhizorhapis sp.]
MLHLVHSVPGRLRLQGDRFRGNVLLIEAAQARILQIDGIISTTAVWATGSIVIQYCRYSLTSEELWGALGETGYVASPTAGGMLRNENSLALGPMIADTVRQTLVKTLVERSTAALIGALI